MRLTASEDFRGWDLWVLVFFKAPKRGLSMFISFFQHTKIDQRISLLTVYKV